MFLEVQSARLLDVLEAATSTELEAHLTWMLQLCRYHDGLRRMMGTVRRPCSCKDQDRTRVAIFCCLYPHLPAAAISQDFEIRNIPSKKADIWARCAEGS